MANAKSTSTGKEGRLKARTSRSIENSDASSNVPPTQTCSHGVISGTGYAPATGPMVRVVDGPERPFGGEVRPL